MYGTTTIRGTSSNFSPITFEDLKEALQNTIENNIKSAKKLNDEGEIRKLSLLKNEINGLNEPTLSDEIYKFGNLLSKIIGNRDITSMLYGFIAKDDVAINSPSIEKRCAYLRPFNDQQTDLYYIHYDAMSYKIESIGRTREELMQPLYNIQTYPPDKISTVINNRNDLDGLKYKFVYQLYRMYYMQLYTWNIYISKNISYFKINEYIKELRRQYDVPIKYCNDWAYDDKFRHFKHTNSFFVEKQKLEKYYNIEINLNEQTRIKFSHIRDHGIMSIAIFGSILGAMIIPSNIITWVWNIIILYCLVTSFLYIRGYLLFNVADAFNYVRLKYKIRIMLLLKKLAEKLEK